MGYRLAAAGPRTRQRLIDRETAALAPPEPGWNEPLPPNEPLPALASWDNTLWEQRLAADAELGMARLSAQQSRFPVWRAAALLASAACGFSLVLFGQSLHLDRKLREANRPAKPTLVAEAQPPAPQPAPAQVQPAPAQPAPSLASAPALPSNPNPAPLAQPAASPVQAPSPSPLPQISQAARPGEARKPHLAQPALARQPAPRPLFATATPDPKWAEPRPHPANHAAVPHHDLPRWLTEDRPQHERELIMSPPPHNLDAPPGAELAANTHPAPSPKTDLPPIPRPFHRPALIYAEAHNAPPPPTFWAAPRPTYNANPYYAPSPQTYFYYGAMPPPTPYGAP
jgi:hypothetical protein